MKINQLWQSDAIDLTQRKCIIISGQAGWGFDELFEVRLMSHPKRYTTKNKCLKEAQSCFEQEQVQTDER